MKNTNLIFVLSLVLLTSACSMKVESFYHEDATMESNMKLDFSDEAFAKLKSFGGEKIKSDSANKAKLEKVKELKKFLNKRVSINELMFLTNTYDSLNISKIDFFDKIFLEVKADVSLKDSIRDVEVNIYVAEHTSESIKKDVMQTLNLVTTMSDTISDIKKKQQMQTALDQLLSLIHI